VRRAARDRAIQRSPSPMEVGRTSVAILITVPAHRARTRAGTVRVRGPSHDCAGRGKLGTDVRCLGGARGGERCPRTSSPALKKSHDPPPSDLKRPRLVTAREGRGVRVHAQWETTSHELHAALTGERQGYYVDFGSLPAGQHAASGVLPHRHRSALPRPRRPVVKPTYPGSPVRIFAEPLRSQRPPATDLAAFPPPAGLRRSPVLCSPYTPMLFMGRSGRAHPVEFLSHFPDPELGKTSGWPDQGVRQHGWDAPPPCRTERGRTSSTPS